MEVATDEWIQSKNIDKTGRTPHTTPQGGQKAQEYTQGSWLEQIYEIVWLNIYNQTKPQHLHKRKIIKDPIPCLVDFPIPWAFGSPEKSGKTPKIPSFP